MSKPKLLILSGIAVFPQSSGGATRLKHTILELSKRYELYLWYWNAESHHLTVDEKKFLSTHCQDFKIVDCHSKSIFSFLFGIPYHFSNYFSPDLKATLSNYCQTHKIQKIRIEAAQLLYLIDYLPLNCETQYVAHDVVTESFWRRATDATNPLRKLLRFCHFWQTTSYERKYIKKPAAVIAVSDVDVVHIKKMLDGQQQISVEPNGVAAIHPLPLPNKLRIGFIGSPTHTPNQAAIDFIYTKLAPKFALEKLNCQFVLCGKGIEEFIARYQPQSNVTVIDSVSELEMFYSQISVLVAPIFSGSGTRIKILEALSFGRSVVSTQVGAEGIKISSPYLRVLSINQELNTEAWKVEIETSHVVTHCAVQEQRKLNKQLTPYQWSSIFAQS